MTAEIVSIAVARPSGAYGHELPPARKFVEDAAAHVRELAGVVDARLCELTGAQATCGAVAGAIRAAAGRLRDAAEGLFVLAYAGHGGRVRDRSGDEVDHYDEVWALDDAPLTDDVLTALLDLLHPDVHVVLISNCCFSAGIVDGVGDGVTDRLKASAPPMGRWAMGSSDALRVADALAAAAAPEVTNRVVIASCGDHQMMVLPDASRLTSHVLDAVFPREGEVRRRRPTDYAALEQIVHAMATVTQTPIVLATDPDKRRPAFVAQPLHARS